ncbi:MAG: flagellar filament capping protein FliD [Fimbriimonadaceae bacterium]|nr:flagellar filament capping protein FliD [Chthonomonadaceae bacterium]MCO5295299.1 flagellar filament capping protein FliD [Fimbriimonadaceae bacterium]
MSIGSSLSGITFSGLSSGIDTEGLIKQLLQVEAIPIQRLQLQEAQLNSRSSVLQQLKNQMQTLSTNAAGLNSLAAFNPISASTSDSSVATLSATSGAVAGSYDLSVSKLAKAHKFSSSAQSDTTSALGLAGKFVVNGKAVDVVATDSLAAVAQKITNANVGVTASVIDGGAGSAYLTITASSTGATNKIQIADLSGTVADTLGLVAGAATIRESIANGATSFGFSSSTTAVGSLFGATGLASGTVLINGVGVSIDPNADSLQAIADKINAAGTGATATVRSAQKNGATVYKLDISGATTPTFADDQNILGSLGILQQPIGSELVAAQSAEYTLDTIAFTSETNAITTVIPGVTLTLLSADETTPKTSTLTLQRDTDGVKSSVQGFVDSFNGVIDFIKQNSAFDKDTFNSGALFGDPVARQVESAITDLLFNTVPGLTGTYTNLSQLGFSMGEEGKLTFDQAAFDTAMAADPAGVSAVFRAMGKGSTDSITYVSSSDKTVASGTGSYDVVISQIATKGSYTGSVAQTAPSSVPETLTFDGTLFGSTPYQLVLPIGSTAAAAVDQINNDSALKDLVVASLDGGLLKIESKRYGANGNFTVDSDTAAASDTSGIGIGQPGTVSTGLDVAGTINGEAATGSGQFLVGNTGNAKTSGLQIQYTGIDTGLVGTIKFTKGIAAQMTDSVFTFTDSVSGLLTSTDQSIQDQVASIEQQIADIQERLASRETELRARFAAMEQTMAQYQSQAARLGALNQNTG